MVRISCKQQGICRRFTSMAACSAATRPSPNEKSLPRGGPCWLSYVTPRCDVSLSCKRPALWAPGALPTVDFLLHYLGAVVNKMGVKSLVGPVADPTGRAPAPKANGGAEAPPWI